MLDSFSGVFELMFAFINEINWTPTRDASVEHVNRSTRLCGVVQLNALHTGPLIIRVKVQWKRFVRKINGFCPLTHKGIKKSTVDFYFLCGQRRLAKGWFVLLRRGCRKRE